VVLEYQVYNYIKAKFKDSNNSICKIRQKNKLLIILSIIMN